jgi:hypothetical protein
VEADGRKYDELHVDGGAVAEVITAEEPVERRIL